MTVQVAEAVMSRKALDWAAQQDIPDQGAKLTLMLIADRTTRQGLCLATEDDYAEMAREAAAIEARLAGDHSIRWGVDNDRVNRIVKALQRASRPTRDTTDSD
jgi:hypothetical protein